MKGQRLKKPSRWLNPAGGYLTGYSHTLNPYSGCAFSCSYCYVRRMPIALFREEEWGEWVDIKTFDRNSFVKEWSRALSKGRVTIFMSSSTDPYQPLEAEFGVTRAILDVMAEEPPAFVMLQTRSPLVLRDRDLVKRLGSRIRVSMTLETDREDIRKALTPKAPPLAARWRAIQELQAEGIAVQAAVSPLLPHTDRFAERLAGAVPLAVVDDFFRGDGSKGRRTQQLGMASVYEAIGVQEAYTPQYADRFFAELSERMPPGTVKQGQEGFLPPQPDFKHL
ncbi:radical SAM protein [Paenibacillus tarimensis]